ncbi:MAG: phospholipid carrier-dependent glycosyltransferase [bacterium]|nr:phospholipid carrier-dependent glycosyltransferase [bacterium]
MVTVLVAYLLGIKILSLLKLRLQPLEKLLISFGLGFISISFFVMLLCFIGQVYIHYILIFFIIILLISIKELKSLKSYFKTSFRPGFDFKTIILLAFILLAAGNFISAFAPAAEWDSVYYHLSIPKAFVTHHSFVDLPHMLPATWPMGIEMFYVIGEMIHSSTFSHLIAWLLGLLAAVSVVAIVSKFISREAALVSGIIFYSMPVIIERASQPMIDLSMTFFFALALLCFLSINSKQNFKPKEDHRWLILFAVFVSFLMAIKFTGIFFAFCFAVVLFLKNRKLFIRFLIIMLIISSVLVLPYFARSYAIRDNPLFPYETPLFGSGGEGLSEESYEQIWGSIHSRPFSVNEVVMLPYRLFLDPYLLASTLGIGVFCFIFFPLSFIFFRKYKALFIPLLLIAFIYTIFWLNAVSTLRYYLQIILILVILSSIPYSHFISRKGPVRYVIMGVIMVSLMFSAAIWAGINHNEMSEVAGIQSESEYFDNLRSSNPRNALVFYNEHVQGEKLLFLNEFRAYYCDRDYTLAHMILNPDINYYAVQSYDDLIRELEDNNISHILVNDNYDYDAFKIMYFEHAYNIFPEVFEKNSKILYDENNIKIYEITYS